MNLSPDLATTAPAAPAGELAAGTSFAQFRIVGVLGRGGMGAVMEAFDRELDRRVAIKVLHAGADARVDLVREAQAMARLAHPNVVTVYEVGRVDERAFVVMELVDGLTLRAWLDARPRTAREIVTMFVGAGRGLAAAHEAGLVHGDFKPENVMIGDADARPRVTDFGTRGIAGTPAYMAPEQWSGDEEEVDARADQFAFCVALWSALWGEAPFAGDTAPELQTSVVAGERRAVPDGAGPRWLVAVVQRGLAMDPAARWPSLAALLDELERGFARRRRGFAMAAAGGAAIAIAGAAAALALTMGGPHQVPIVACEAPTTRVTTAWTARRGAIAQHLAAIDPANGAKRFAAVAAVLDRDLATWSEAHVDACVATRDGVQVDAVLDQRMHCLDAWLARATGVADRLAHVQAARELEDAITAARDVGEIAACADAAALGAVVPPPPAAIRAQVEALRAELDAAEAARLAGHTEHEPAQSLAFVERARAFAYPPILAAALFYRERVQASRFAEGNAIDTARELVDAAAQSHDDALAAHAWLELVGALVSGHHTKEGLQLVPAARAAVVRAGDAPAQRAELAWREGMALFATGSVDAGIARLDDGRALCVALGADEPGSHLLPLLDSIDGALGDAWSFKPDPVKAVAAYEAAIDESERAFGPDNADETFAMNDLVLALLAENKMDEALATAQHLLQVRETRFGTSALVITNSLNLIAQTLGQQGKEREALPYIKRSRQIYLTSPEASPLDRAGAAIELAIAEDDLHDDVAALADYTTTVDNYEKLLPDVQDNSIANAILDRGEFLAQRGRCKDAMHDLEHALELRENWHGKDDYWLVQPLEFIGRCDVLLGHPAEALAPLARAVAFPNVPDNMVIERDLSRYYLARANYALGKDRGAALAEARAARAVVATTGDKDALALIDPWLTHPQ